MDKFFNLIANPTSKNGMTTLQKVEAVLKAKNVSFLSHVCDKPEHAREVAKQISTTGGNIVAIGGDGTFNNIINGITNFDKVNMGFIVGGTGNDFSATFNVKKDPELAINDILMGNMGKVDLIDVCGRKCLNVCATGLDIETLKRYAKMKVFKGKIKYTVALLITLIRFGSYHAVYKIDGKEYDEQALIIAGGNGTRFGGGMMVTPHGDVTDGKISITVVNKVPKIKYPFILPRFIKGKHDKVQKYIKHFYCEEFEVSLPDEEIPVFQLDGEIIENKPFKCKIVPQLLNVFMPSKT